MKFRLLVVATAIGICPISVMFGFEGAQASDPLTQFCSDAELYIRKNDGFPQSDVAGELSKSGLLSFGPPGETLPSDVIAAVQQDGLGRELFDGYAGGFQMLEFGPRAAIFAVESVAGTAGCQTLWFFRRRADGKLEAVAGPSRPIGGCSGDAARMGEVVGIPVIIDESYWDAVSKLKFLAWRGRAWERACSFSATYRMGFEVAEEQCSGEMCEEFRGKITSWAEAVRDSEDGKPVPDTLGLATVTQVPEKELNARNLQTGLAAKPNVRAPLFLRNSPLFDAELGGKPYRIRIGRLDWGTSVSSDQYLVAIFEGASTSQLPIAGYVLTARRKSLSALIVEQ